MSNIDVRKMKSAAQAATPGPWTVGGYTVPAERQVLHADGSLCCTVADGGRVRTGPNAAHIATSNPAAMLALIDLAERLAPYVRNRTCSCMPSSGRACEACDAQRELINEAKAAWLLGGEGDND